jgi:hypothetical protein
MRVLAAVYEAALKNRNGREADVRSA